MQVYRGDGLNGTLEIGRTVMSSLGITDVVSELSVELAEEECVAVGLGLRLCAGNQGFGVGHGVNSERIV